MILAFLLSMPGCASWNGRWKGNIYAKTIQTRGRLSDLKAADILRTGYYHYNFGDGWTASVSVKEVDAAEARRLRKASRGFCGYDWMVESILNKGQIEPEVRR